MVDESEMQRTLLLVDDEKNVLSSLKRLFRRSGYNILSANSGEEGLELIANNPVGVIVSDQRMPEMTGVEFLSKVKESNPETIRIILSGYTELKSITEAINKGSIYKFLTKPWEDEEILTEVAKAFERYEMKIIDRWVGDEIKQVNKYLEKENEALTRNIEKKSEEVKIHKVTLNTAYEVLADMPVGLIIIGSDEIISMTNKLSEKWFSEKNLYLVGNKAESVLPEGILSIYKRVIDIDGSISENIMFGKDMEMKVSCKKLNDSACKDCIVFILTEI